MLSFCITAEADRWPRSWRSRQSLAVGAGLCAQTGAIALDLGCLITAAALILASIIAWTLLFAGYTGLSSQQTAGRILRWAFSFALTTGYLLLQGSNGSGWFGVSFARHAAPGFRAAARTRSIPQGGGTSASQFHHAYVGIVLWPKRQTYTKLIAPTPISFRQKPSSKERERPLIVPFQGVYWFYRAPDVQPPAKSREAQGSPEIFDIRSTDRLPLSMEARQNLGSLIDLGCCSRIQVAIRNADRYPRSVSLELVLVDTASPGRPHQSLGMQNVNSTRPWRLYQDRSPATETLSFAIPFRSAIRLFDEIHKVFHLDVDRADAGARIGIDHLTLVPRGL